VWRIAGRQPAVGPSGHVGSVCPRPAVAARALRTEMATSPRDAWFTPLRFPRPEESVAPADNTFSRVACRRLAAVRVSARRAQIAQLRAGSLEPRASHEDRHARRGAGRRRRRAASTRRRPDAAASMRFVGL